MTSYKIAGVFNLVTALLCTAAVLIWIFQLRQLNILLLFADGDAMVAWVPYFVILTAILNIVGVYWMFFTSKVMKQKRFLLSVIFSSFTLVALVIIILFNIWFCLVGSALMQIGGAIIGLDSSHLTFATCMRTLVGF